MAATRALIRRGIKRLHLVALPTSTLQADVLIGAGCIDTLETSAVSLGEFGPAPRFTAAILSGTIRMRDATCPALHAQFQAAEKGVPFMPLRGSSAPTCWLIGPERTGRSSTIRSAKILLVMPIRSCCSRRSSPMSLCFMRRWPIEWQCFRRHTARTCDDGARSTKDPCHGREDPRGRSSARSVARGGHLARLLCRSGRCRAARRMAAALPDHYRIDAAQVAEYARLAATAEGFAEYLQRYVLLARGSRCMSGVPA